MADTVLIRRRALGDVILLGSITGALAGRVAVVTEPRWQALVQRLIGVDQVHSWPTLPPGDWVDLQGDLLTLRATRGRARRIRKRSLRRRLRLWWGMGSPRPTVPELYGEAAGVSPVAPPWIDLERRPDGTLVIAPGAAWGAKRYAPARFIDLARSWPGRVQVIGGPAERDLVRAIAEASGAEGLAEEGFEATLRSLERASCVVAGDTGLMHLAGACAVPVVAIFGPTDPLDGFFVYDGLVVHRELACRPCTLHRQPACPLGHHACMDLSVDRVLEAALALADRHR